MKIIIKTLKILIFFFSFCLVALLGSTVFYPANQKWATIPAVELPGISSVDSSVDLEKYLKAEESPLVLKHDTEKKIIWATADKRITDLSIVYLHGFSATRQEIFPVVEKLGEKLGANVFLTRLHGHGMDSESFGKATAQEWIDDANEAFAIGKRLGHQVILIGTSTGASLAIHLAQNNPPEIKAMILLSTNFRPTSLLSWLASGPAGNLIARMVLGKSRSWTPINEQQAYFWTTTYPSEAVHEMMDFLKYINLINLQKITIPTLMLYTDKDTVVSIPLIKQKYAELGSAQKKLTRMNSPDHIMAGNIIAKEMNEPVINEILAFLKSLL